ncbi:MAG: LacI family DNA-binding transcriptional regulator [Pseudomonadota bacterium]
MNIKKPTLHTVARKARVSVATASQVLRDTGRISQQTRKRVLKAAQQLNYVRDGRAASMRSGVSREIGLVIHGIANPFNAEVISGISEYLEFQDYLVSVLDSQNDSTKEERNLRTFIASGRSGIIWVPTANVLAQTTQLLLTNHVPTITFLNSFADSPFDHVGIRNAKATYDSTSYLIAMRHKRIAYFGGEGRSYVRRERIRGYREALAEHALSEPIIWDCEDRKQTASDAMMRLCQTHPDVTAIICNGDQVALGACLSLTTQHKTIGQDISIIGFDDIADAALSNPPLSTMAVSPMDLGRQLARVMINRINHPEQKQVHMDVTAELILRHTTGAPP